jgi:hypothetical protein
MAFDLFDILGWLGLAVLIIVIVRALWSRLRPPPLPELPESALAVRLPLPEGAWEAFNSPGSKVPSHGTDWLGQRFAIDLVGVEPGRGHSEVRDWRTLLWLERPDRFIGFGSPVVAPAAGTVVAAYDRVADRGACRSIPGLIWFFAGSMALAVTTLVWRTPAGLSAMLGNHVILRLDQGGHAGLMHLRRGSVRVSAGEHLEEGQRIADVGNTGNTTQPHLHFQLMDRPDALAAKGLPLAFADYEIKGDDAWVAVQRGVPTNGTFLRQAQSR